MTAQLLSPARLHDLDLRNHMVMRDGRIRDSVLFSLIADEWPLVKERLQQIMSSQGVPLRS